MDALQLLITRRSSKKLAAPAPDAGQLEQILQAATQVPDHGNMRPFHFTVIQKYTDGTTEVQQCSVGSDTVYLFTSGTNLSKQLNMKAKSLYTTFTYTPDNITIEHHTLKIQIVLEPIHNY